jgi:myo-inositol 2-dehydrogenase / D-chiro-inositol 1-dehydrogenase
MKKLKAGIAGLGRIGKIHLSNLLSSPQVEVVAAMDPVEGCLQHARDLQIPFLTVNIEELINHPEVEAVIICSPTNTHADYVEMAAKGGKYIFCEKPLDLSLERVVQVLKVVEERGTKLMMGFNRRFDPEFKKVRSVVMDGGIGEAHIVKITSRDPGAPPVSYIKTSGGLFLDMTIHDFDMARFVVGKEVAEVFAKGTVLVDKAIGEAGDIDTAVVLLTYEDGTIAVIDNSREAVYGYDQRLEVFGSKGMVQADNRFADAHRIYNAGGIHGSLPLHFFLERYEAAYRNEMNEFVSAVLSGSPLPVEGKDGLKSLLIGLAALKSVQENRPVKISEITY